MVWASQFVVSCKGRVRRLGGLGVMSVPGFSTAASTNATNDATALLFNHPNAPPPYLFHPLSLWEEHHRTVSLR